MVPKSRGSFDSAPCHSASRCAQEDRIAGEYSAAFSVTRQVRVIYYAASVYYDCFQTGRT
jgi:hypothetical protein